MRANAGSQTPTTGITVFKSYKVAAATAIEKVFKVKPDLTREGGSIPVTLTFQDVTLPNSGLEQECAAASYGPCR
jgi:hypothetical protein